MTCKLLLDDLHPDVRQVLESALYDEEELLWFAQPVCRLGCLRTVSRLFLTVANFLTLGCIALMCVRIPEPFESKRYNWIILLVILVVFALAIGLLCRAIHQRVSKTLYVLTNSRALVVAPPLMSSPQAICYPLNERLIQKVIIRKDDGDIIFEENRMLTMYSYVAERRGFLNCPNAKDVTERIRQLVSTRMPTNGSDSGEVDADTLS